MVGSGRTEEELREAKEVEKHVKEELENAPTTTSTMETQVETAEDSQTKSASLNSSTDKDEVPAAKMVSPSAGVGQRQLEDSAAATAAAGSTVPVPVAVAVTLGAAADVPNSTPEGPGHEHTIQDAAREHPEAPIKDLAAALEGATL